MKVKAIRTTDNRVITMDINVEEVHHYILENGLVSHNSSVASETTNGLYPIRDFDLLKTNDTGAVAYVVPDSTKLRSRYEIAWDIDSSDLIKVYAIIQKWTDQAISADLYRRMQGDSKVGTTEMLNTYLDLVRYGVKTRYYQNSLTGKEVILDSTESVVEYADSDEDAECESCKL